MLLKKPSILFGAYTNIHSLPSVSGSSTSSSRRRESTRQQRSSRRERRGYATIADNAQEHHGAQEQHGHAEHPWPKPLEGQTCPTPYQIFAMKHKATYSKSRFYELVKVYHPDLSNGSSPDNVSHQMKMERYRLIVAAHTILSDPAKRSAYDRFGAGWNGRAEVGGQPTWAQGSAQPGPFSHSWSDPADPIWQNATWEDWERFYARRAREQGAAQGTAQEQQGQGLYMQNAYFIALVMLLALMGGSANYNRAQDAGTLFVEQRDLVHDRAAKELRKVRQEMSGIKGRDERIQWFLRQREAAMGQMAVTDLDAMREERANRLLPDREVCRSEKVSEKDT